jgi:hypothetical protein
MINPAMVPKDPQKAFGILLLAYLVCVPYTLYLFWQIRQGRASTKTGHISRKKNPGDFWALIGLQLAITSAILISSLVNFINQFVSFRQRCLT